MGSRIINTKWPDKVIQGHRSYSDTKKTPRVISPSLLQRGNFLRSSVWTHSGVLFCHIRCSFQHLSWFYLFLVLPHHSVSLSNLPGDSLSLQNSKTGPRSWAWNRCLSPHLPHSIANTAHSWQLLLDPSKFAILRPVSPKPEGPQGGDESSLMDCPELTGNKGKWEMFWSKRNRNVLLF